MSINFIEGETYCANYGLSNQASYTPVFMEADGKRFFVRNIAKPHKYDTWGKLDHQRSIDDAKKAKRQLLENNGKYCCFYGLKNNPFDFIKWVKENKYTLEIHGRLFVDSENGFTDFHGNVVEYSAAFTYRIYDENMIHELKSIVKAMPQHKR